MEDSAKVKEFISLLTANQQPIFNYVLARVVRPSDADDVMQETTAEMWKKFEQYRPGSDFLAWGITIARYKILDHSRKTHSRTRFLSDETIELLDADQRRPAEAADERIEQLRKCINKLPQQFRSLVRVRYTDGLPSKDIAQRYGRNISSVYRMLAKTHELLLGCLKRSTLLSSD